MLEDLIVLITAAGLGTYNVDLFKGAKAIIPPGEGPFTTLIATGGATPEGTHNSVDVPAYIRPSCQFVVRADDYDVAEVRAKALYALVFGIRNQFVNGCWWRQVTMVQSEPFDLGADDASRARVAFSIDVIKRLSAATS